MRDALPIRVQVEQLNTWLAEIWEEPLRLSAALSLGGLPEDALPVLRAQLDEYLPLAQEAIAQLLFERFPSRQASIALEYWGLTGAAPLGEHELAARHGLSHEQVARFIRQATRRMQSQRRRVALLHALVGVAASVLTIPAPAPVVRRTLAPIRRRRSPHAGPSADSVAPPAEHAVGTPLDPPPAVARPGGGGRKTSCNTLELFRQGMAPAAIAEARGLAFSTIAAHLTWWLGRGAISLEDLVTPEQRARVEAAQTHRGMRLRDLKARLPDLDYAVITWVLKAQQRKAGLAAMEASAEPVGGMQ